MTPQLPPALSFLSLAHQCTISLSEPAPRLASALLWHFPDCFLSSGPLQLAPIQCRMNGFYLWFRAWWFLCSKSIQQQPHCLWDIVQIPSPTQAGPIPPLKLLLPIRDHSFRRSSRVQSPGKQTRLASVFLIQLIHCPSGKSALFPTESSAWSFAIFFFLSFQQQRPSLLDAETFFFFLIQRELQRPLDSFSHLKLKSGSHFYPESCQGLSAHLPLEVVHSSPAEPWPFFPLSWNQPPGDSLPSVVIVPSGAIPTNLGCTGFRKVKSQKKELCSPLNTTTFESMSPCSLWAEVIQITKVLSTTLPEQINYLKIMPLTWLRYLYIRNIYGSVPECHSNPQDKYYSSSWNFNFKDAFEMREINIFKCIFALKCKITMFYKKNKFCFFYGTLQIIVSRSPRQISFSPAPIWGKHFKDCANISPPPCGGRCQKLEVLHRLDSLLQFLMYPNSNPKFLT